MSFASGAIDLEEVRNKISNWSNEQSGSTKNYPSINAMEEYVNNQVNSTLKNVQPDWNASEDQPGHILNRTHYVEQTVINPVYNGDPIGKEIVQLDPQIQYIKMSDNPIVDESYIGS